MILGLAKNADKRPLQTRRAAQGLFVVINAYAGSYEYFAEGDSAIEQTCYDNATSETSDNHGDASKRTSGTESQHD